MTEKLDSIDTESDILRRKVVEQDKVIADLNKTIDKLSESETDGHIEFNALKHDRDELHSALNKIVSLYIMNRGKPSSEFIACITPKSACEMSPIERMRNKYWQAWDRARLALGEGKDE